jgi:hypothetical protein
MHNSKAILITSTSDNVPAKTVTLSQATFDALLSKEMIPYVDDDVPVLKDALMHRIVTLPTVARKNSPPSLLHVYAIAKPDGQLQYLCLTPSMFRKKEHVFPWTTRLWSLPMLLLLEEQAQPQQGSKATKKKGMPGNAAAAYHTMTTSASEIPMATIVAWLGDWFVLNHAASTVPFSIMKYLHYLSDAQHPFDARRGRPFFEQDEVVDGTLNASGNNEDHSDDDDDDNEEGMAQTGYDQEEEEEMDEEDDEEDLEGEEDEDDDGMLEEDDDDDLIGGEASSVGETC